MFANSFPYVLVRDHLFPALLTACELSADSVTIIAGGSGYATNDTIGIAGGTFSQAVILQVAGVSSGSVTATTIYNPGAYTVFPTGTVTQSSTSGSGTSASFTLTNNPTYLYSWTEQNYAVDGTLAPAYPSPRQGNAFVNAAVELNNNFVPQTYVWMRLAHANGGSDQTYEFSVAGAASITFIAGSTTTTTSVLTVTGMGGTTASLNGDTLTINSPVPTALTIANVNNTTTHTDHNAGSITFNGFGLLLGNSTPGNDTVGAAGPTTSIQSNQNGAMYGDDSFTYTTTASHVQTQLQVPTNSGPGIGQTFDGSFVVNTVGYEAGGDTTTTGYLTEIGCNRNGGQFGINVTRLQNGGAQYQASLVTSIGNDGSPGNAQGLAAGYFVLPDQQVVVLCGQVLDPTYTVQYPAGFFNNIYTQAYICTETSYNAIYGNPANFGPGLSNTGSDGWPFGLLTNTYIGGFGYFAQGWPGGTGSVYFPSDSITLTFIGGLFYGANSGVTYPTGPLPPPPPGPPSGPTGYPTVSSITPVSGPTSGNTTVTITGTNLLFTSAVSFGAIGASTFFGATSSQVTAVTPAETAATVNVTVTNAIGTSTTTFADQFTFVSPPSPPTTPTITLLNGHYSQLVGGATLTVTGASFGPGPFGASGSVTAAAVGGVAVSGCEIYASTFGAIQTPPNAAGTYDLTFTNAAGTSATSSADTITYIPAPNVSSVSPTSGPSTGGTTVTITGTGFVVAAASQTLVYCNDNSAFLTGVTINSPTSITAITPAHPLGTIPLIVAIANVAGTYSATDSFTFAAAHGSDTFGTNGSSTTFTAPVTGSYTITCYGSGQGGEG